MNTPNDSTCTSCGTYWTTLVAAVESLTTASSNQFRWGLKLFPSPSDADACLVTPAPDVPLASGTNTTIAATLGAAPPSGGAPLATAVRETADYLGALPDDAPHFILLALGGPPTCAANDPTQEDLSAAVAEVDRAPEFAFVLGFGSGRATFGKLAVVGATESAYAPDEIPSLLQAIESLAKSLASCAFPVPGGALAGRSVSVLLDGDQLEAGGADGFTLSSDGTQIVLRGSACFYLGAHSGLTIDVGCGG